MGVFEAAKYNGAVFFNSTSPSIQKNRFLFQKIIFFAVNRVWTPQFTFDGHKNLHATRPRYYKYIL